MRYLKNSVKLGLIITTLGIISISLFISESAYADLDYCRYVATIKICNSIIPEEDWIDNNQLSSNQMNIIINFFNTPKIFDTPFISQNNWDSRYPNASPDELEMIYKIKEQARITAAINNQQQMNYFRIGQCAECGYVDSTARINSGIKSTNTFNPSTYSISPPSFDFVPSSIANPSLNFQTVPSLSSSGYSIPSSSYQNTYQNSISINYQNNINDHIRTQQLPFPTTLNTGP